MRGISARLPVSLGYWKACCAPRGAGALQRGFPRARDWPAWAVPVRPFSGNTFSRSQAARQATEVAEANKRVGTYALSLAIFTVASAYASVPLYKMFCQVCPSPASLVCLALH